MVTPTPKAKKQNVVQNVAVATPTPEPPIPEPSMPLEKTIIINQSFPVTASSFIPIKFDLRTTARITGNFVAQGGGNDIYCVIVDESENLVEAETRVEIQKVENVSQAIAEEIPLNVGIRSRWQL